MKALIEELKKDIKFINSKNPLSAVGVHDNKPVYKYSYNPLTGKLLLSRPGENHAEAIARANDTKNFDRYVRVIYDVNKNIAGSRIWGAENYENGNPDADVRSFEAQFAAFKFFKKYNPKLKWILNLTNDDLNKGVETLDLNKIPKNRIIESKDFIIIDFNFKKLKIGW